MTGQNFRLATPEESRMVFKNIRFALGAVSALSDGRLWFEANGGRSSSHLPPKAKPGASTKRLPKLPTRKVKPVDRKKGGR